MKCIKYFVCALMLTLVATAKTYASTSSILIDAQSGNVLYADNADVRRYPASLTKLMTLYITFNALENGKLKLDDELKISYTAANRSPSRLGLTPGKTIDVKTAILATIIKSANDCATVLAEGLGYSEANFAKTMTEVAHELGMKNTTFKNASGLPNRAQKTTARDMALLGAAMYHHFPQYYKLFSAKKFTYQGKTYYTHNHILKSFEGADGMKTGFTNAAGFNIITSAERDGKRVIAVTMGHNTAKLRDQKVAKLMDMGLTKLAEANHDAVAAGQYLTAENRDISKNNDLTISTEDSTPSSEVQIASNNWAVQVGAFSNYAKARNYALSVKKEITKQYRNKDINIEPYQNGSAVIYRSQLTGFAKNEADKLCNRLKKSNKSCIVVASTNETLILANKF